MDAEQQQDYQVDAIKPSRTLVVRGIPAAGEKLFEAQVQAEPGFVRTRVFFDFKTVEFASDALEKYNGKEIVPGQLPVELEYEVDEFIGVGKKRKLDDFGGVSKRRRTDSSVSLPIGEWTRYRLDSYGINYFSVNSDSHFCFQPETEPAQSTPLSPELEELTDPNLTASFIKSFVSLESAKKTNLSRRQFSFASHLHQIYRYSAAGNSSSASTTIHGILDGLISNLLAGAGLLDHRFCLRTSPYWEVDLFSRRHNVQCALGVHTFGVVPSLRHLTDFYFLVMYKNPNLVDMGIPVGVIAGQLLAATASNLVHSKTHPLFLMYISDTNVKFFSSQFSSMMMDPIMEGHGQGGHTRDVIQQIPEDSKSWSLIVPEERKRIFEILALIQKQIVLWSNYEDQRDIEKDQLKNSIKNQ